MATNAHWAAYLLGVLRATILRTILRIALVVSLIRHDGDLTTEMGNTISREVENCPYKAFLCGRLPMRW